MTPNYIDGEHARIMFIVPERLKGTKIGRGDFSDSWLRADLYEWIEFKRKEAHVNVYKRLDGHIELSFYHEPHATEFMLVWSEKD